MKKVTVSASSEYEVIIDNNLLDSTGEYVRKYAGGKIAVVITDDIVDGLYSDRVINSLENNLPLIIVLHATS